MCHAALTQQGCGVQPLQHPSLRSVFHSKLSFIPRPMDQKGNKGSDIGSYLQEHIALSSKPLTRILLMLLSPSPSNLDPEPLNIPKPQALNSTLTLHQAKKNQHVGFGTTKKWKNPSIPEPGRKIRQELLKACDRLVVVDFASPQRPWQKSGRGEDRNSGEVPVGCCCGWFVCLLICLFVCFLRSEMVLVGCS